MKKKVAYLHPGLSSFVKKDIDILNKQFELSIHFFDLSSKKKLPVSFAKQFFFLLKEVFFSKVWIVQFAGYQSFLPVLMGRMFFKKVVLVLGGTDCVSFPSIQYGCFYNKNLRPFTKFSIRHADLLLPVDQTLVEYKYSYQENDFPTQGYKAHIQHVKTPYKVIYNGFNADQWKPIEKESNSFVTVAADLGTRFGVLLKGIDLFVEMARCFPESNFYIVGGKNLSGEYPENLHLIGQIPNEELPKFIGSKEFYMQLSLSEGFPNALSEAMLCGCIPIVSNVGAMPMIVEESGYVLKQKDADLLQEIISKAIHDPDKSTKQLLARKIIETQYTLTRREEELIKSISELF